MTVWHGYNCRPVYLRQVLNKHVAIWEGVRSEYDAFVTFLPPLSAHGFAGTAITAFMCLVMCIVSIWVRYFDNICDNCTSIRCRCIFPRNAPDASKLVDRGCRGCICSRRNTYFRGHRNSGMQVLAIFKCFKFLIHSGDIGGQSCV